MQLLGNMCGVIKCISCNLVFKELAPNAKGLLDIYSESYVHFDIISPSLGAAEVISAKQKLNRCMKLIGNGRRIQDLRMLDIGCGSGGFVQIATEMGISAEGIDPYLPEHLASSRLSKKTSEDIPPDSYDIAILLNVIEHLTDPCKTFSSVYRLLKPGGIMLVNGPYGDSMARRVYKAEWIHMVLDEHLLFWTPATLVSTLSKIGFSSNFSYRIAGSPFPFGRQRVNSESSNTNSSVNIPSSHKKNNLKLQDYVWKWARKIQQHETTSNIIRELVHHTNSGDYLELAIIVDK